MKMKNSTVVETITRKDPMRSDCIEWEMHQKLFGGWEGGGLRPDPLGELKVPPGPRCIYGRAGQWGSDGGKDKGGDGRWGEDRRKEREGRE